MKIKVSIIVEATLVVGAFAPAGAAWQEVPLPPKEDTFIYWMDFARPDIGFACTSDPLDPRPFLKYRDGRWMDGSFVFNALATDGCFLPNGYGWVVGGSTRIYPCIYTFRLQAGSSQLEFVPNPYSSPPGAPRSSTPRVSFATEEDGWLLLKGTPPEILRYEDGYWRSIGNPLPAALGWTIDICFPTAGEGWVSGQNGFAHYQDGKWEFVPGPRVKGLDFTARDDGWAISHDGPNIYHFNGSSWSISYSAPGYYVNGLGFYDRNNGWAILSGYGVESRWLKYDNAGWHKIIPPNGQSGYFPTPFSGEAWFQGFKIERNKTIKTTWHWTTAPNVKPASFGRIKAMFQ